MILGRNAERELLLRELRVSSGAPECKRIISLYGGTGVGTSAITSWLQQTACAESLADAVLFVDTSHPSCTGLTGIISSLHKSVVYPSLDAVSSASEVESLLKKYSQSAEDELKRSGELFEAMMVDWIHSLIVDPETELGEQREPRQPKKILLIIDRHNDNVRLVDSWLLEHVMFNALIKKFADFQFYHSPYLKPDLFVRQVLDLRIVVAGKYPLADQTSDKRWDRWRPTILSVPLRVFSASELEKVLRDYSDVRSEQIAECFASTGGHPMLVRSWINRHLASRQDINEAASEQSRLYLSSALSPSEIRLLRIAAACDWLNSDVLRCFIGGDTERDHAESVLRSHWMCTPCLHMGIPAFALFDQARKDIRSLAVPAGEQTMAELDIIFRSYSNIDGILFEMRPKHSRMVRALANADRFDSSLLPERLFPSSEDDWEFVFRQYASLFVSHEATKSVNDSNRTLIRENNAYYAPNQSEEWSAIIRATWRQRKAEIKKELLAAETAYLEDERRLEAVLMQIEESKNKILEAKKEIEETRDTIRKLERSTPADVSNRDLLAAILSALVLFIVAIPSFFSDFVFSFIGGSTEKHIALQRLFLVFSAVFLALTTWFAGRSFLLRKRRAQQRRNIARLKALREEHSEQQRGLHEREELLSNQQLNARRLRDELLESERRRTTASVALNEPFINDSDVE